MTNKKNTRRALFMSALSLILCFAMLMGTTFAWFTDSVTSANNIIKSGNLDIELYHKNADETAYAPVGADSLFDNVLWEPGHVEVENLMIENLGSLDLKYQFNVNVLNETGSVNQMNKTFKLSDYIRFAIIDGEFEGTREEAVAAAQANSVNVNGLNWSVPGTMAADAEAKLVTLVVWMPENTGNEANHKTGATAPSITLGLNLFATQIESELDSFGPDYDKNAPWTGSIDTKWYFDGPNEEGYYVIDTAEELAGLAQIVNVGAPDPETAEVKQDNFSGKTVKLGGNIDLRNAGWTPIGTTGGDAFSHAFSGTFIGTGYTISNLKVIGSKGVALFGRTGPGAHIEGVTMDNVYASGNDYVGAILGSGYLAQNCIKNCTVKNATIIATPYLTETGVYDGGAKAGAIAGIAYNGNLIGNTVENVSISAYRDLGAVAGMMMFDGNGTIVASGNTVAGVKLNYLGVPGMYADNTPNGSMNDIVGRVGNGASVAEDNTATTVEKNEANKDQIVINTLDELIGFAKEVNAGNTYAGKTVVLGADIDLMNIEWTPIGTSSEGFKGIFDGNNKTISNLKITGNDSTVGLFANTYDGEIKNLTVNNANVSGRLNVGVVAGNPYTSKYTNITVSGHVEVNGMAYVGGVGGKNAYANWDNIKVDVDETSYVKANSVENGTAYRTYVGGVIGFMGEGGHTISNVTSNIDVFGSTCDVGGIVGIAHYGNSFVNISCTGDVSIISATEADEAEEMGGIAGVWNNGGADVTFNKCAFTGSLSSNYTEGVDLSNNTITGKAYSSTGKGNCYIYTTDENGFSLVTSLRADMAPAVVLDDIPAGYANSELTVPNNITALHNGLFGSTAVTTVKVPASVSDFGASGVTATGASGGAFKGSNVTTVVLEEGMTEIPAAAFNGAANLTSVNIPATVKTIGVNAFRSTALTELTVPATVENISYGAFRDMTSLTTVTFEGKHVDIPDYAFRGCTNLRTVYINADTATVGTNMAFSNASSNNPTTNNITFYVKNEDVANQVIASMGVGSYVAIYVNNVLYAEIN